MYEVSLLDVLATAEVDSSHSAGLQAMSKGPFHQLASLAVEGSTSGALDPPTVPVDRLLLIFLAQPFAPSPLRFGDAAARPHALDGHERVVAVVPLVRHPLSGRGFNRARTPLLQPRQAQSRVKHRVVDRGGVARCAGIDRHRQDRAAVQVNRVLGLVSQVRAAVLHLRDLRVRIVGVVPIVVRALLRPLAVDSSQVGLRRRLDSRGLRKIHEEVLIALTRIATHQALHRRIGFERRCVDTNRVAGVDPTGLRCVGCNGASATSGGSGGISGWWEDYKNGYKYAQCKTDCDDDLVWCTTVFAVDWYESCMDFAAWLVANGEEPEIEPLEEQCLQELFVVLGWCSTEWGMCLKGCKKKYGGGDV